MCWTQLKKFGLPSENSARLVPQAGYWPAKDAFHWQKQYEHDAYLIQGHGKPLHFAPAAHTGAMEGPFKNKRILFVAEGPVQAMPHDLHDLARIISSRFCSVNSGF